MIKLFTNRDQIRLLNSKSTDLDWYYSKHFWKLKLLIRDLLFTTFMKTPKRLSYVIIKEFRNKMLPPVRSSSVLVGRSPLLANIVCAT